MKKRVKYVLAAVAAALCLCAGAWAEDGGFAEIGYTPAETGLSAKFELVVTDEQGEEIYSTEYSGAKLLENPMLVKVSSGEIVSVSTDRGEVTGCELDGGTASFVWSGALGKNVITVVVRLPEAPPEPEGTAIRLEQGEALKILYHAGVDVSEVDSVLTAVYTPLDAGPCTLSLSAGGALEGETQSEGGTAATLKLEYTAGGEKQTASLFRRGFELRRSEGGLEIAAEGGVCLVELRNGDFASHTVVETGTPAASIAGHGEGFMGWLLDGELLDGDAITSDCVLTAARWEVTGHAGSGARVLNPGGELERLLEGYLGGAAEALWIRLEGALRSGNAAYADNGWRDGGKYYYVSNCEAEANFEGGCENAHVPYSELRGITLLAEGGGRRLELFLPLEELEAGVNEYGELELRVLAAEEPVEFVDVAEGEWYSEAVEYVCRAGVMTGTGAGFEPNLGMTRSMVWATLARAAGAAADGAEWQLAAQRWALLAGVSDGSDPNGLVTREQFATMLWRSCGRLASGGTLAGYADADAVGAYAREALAWAVGSGVVSGIGGAQLDPQGGATRAQAAVMLARFLLLEG